MHKCICDNWLLDETIDCKCQPYMITDENGDDHTVHALDARAAAIKYAESFFSGDYSLIDESVVIQVGEKRFRIDADVHYSAKEVYRS